MPLSTSTLALSLSFDLSAVPDWPALRERDVGAALTAALASTRLRAPGTVAARSHVTSGPADVAAAHALPLEGDAWAADAAAHPIRIELLWSSAAPAMAMRVLNELSYAGGGGCDGVTALRLAMHVLEALEGGAGAVAAGAPFKTTPPFAFGARHAANALARVPLAMARGNWPWYAAVPAEELAAPTTSAGLRAYYQPGAPAAPARFRGYAAPPGQAKAAYKAMLDMCQSWADRAGLAEFFILNNMSPKAAPSMLPRARDILDVEKRYAGVFMPPGYPAGGALWTALSHLHVYAIFLNNYVGAMRQLTDDLMSHRRRQARAPVPRSPPPPRFMFAGHARDEL